MPRVGVTITRRGVLAGGRVTQVTHAVPRGRVTPGTLRGRDPRDRFDPAGGPFRGDPELAWERLPQVHDRLVLRQFETTATSVRFSMDVEVHRPETGLGVDDEIDDGESAPKGGKADVTSY